MNTKTLFVYIFDFQYEKEEIAKLLRFESSSQPAGKTVSLPEYGANMKAGQRDIYYLAAPRFGFCALNFLSILSREKLTQK
jgi:HSP90 family molecular chaperone